MANRGLAALLLEGKAVHQQQPVDAERHRERRDQGGVKRRLRNRSSGSMGWAARCWLATNAAIPATATTASAAVQGGVSVRPSTSTMRQRAETHDRQRLAADVDLRGIVVAGFGQIDGGSSAARAARRARSARRCSASRSCRSARRRESGRSRCSSRPPSPMPPSPCRARSGRGMRRRRWPGPAGSISAAPTPCTARAANSSGSDGAAAHTSEATTKTVNPTRSSLRLPNRSPSDPDVSSKAAKVMLYASIVHCAPEMPPPRSSRIAGSARLIAFASMSPTNSPR